MTEHNKINEPEIVENSDVPANSDRMDEDGRVWDASATLKLNVGGEDVQIVLRYSDPADAIKAIRGVNQDRNLYTLAVGLGAVPGVELADEDDDDA